jgi:L-cysteine desulfidase
MTARESEIIGLIRKEVKPALGCTEPIAVALAVAKSMEIIEEQSGLESSDWRSDDGFCLNV